MKEENVHKIRKRNLVILFSTLLFLIIWIFIIKLFSNYFVSSVDDNWQQIKAEKTEYQNKICLDLYNKHLHKSREYSNLIAGNLDIRSSLTNGEQTKLFDNLLKFKLPSNVEVEIFNERSEQAAYFGRNIEPDILLLKKASGGKSSLVLKEIGFYKYLINYEPIKSLTDESQYSGVLLCAYQLDFNPQIKNSYFQPYGLCNEISNILNIGSEIIAGKIASDTRASEADSLTNFRYIDLTGFDGTVLGELKIPRYEKPLHINSLVDYSLKIQSVLIFLTSVILTVLVIILLREKESFLLKTITILAVLLIIRYLWVLFEFPNKLINAEIFSPSYYAIPYSLGMLKSLGDLFITSIFCLIFFIFLSVQFQRSIELSGSFENRHRYFQTITVSILLIILIYVLTYLYGLILHSIIYDSNVKFLELTEFLPNAELSIVHLTILILSFSYLLLLASAMISINFQLKYLFKSLLIRKFRIAFLFFILVSVSFVIKFSDIHFEIIHSHRILIFTIVTLFLVYLNRKIYKTRVYRYLTFKNISYLFLICIFITPLFLLGNLKNKEVKYIEVFGKELSQSLQEKATFVIADELANCSQNRELSENIRKSNRIPEISFSIWANSKLIDENFNSAVILLDTNEKIISEFNLNPAQIKTDTIRNFIKRKYFNADFDSSTPDAENDTSFARDNIYEDESANTPEEDIYLPSIYENVDILKYGSENLLIGIISIENIDLRNTQFETSYGYLIIAVNYKFNNVFNKASSSVFLTQNGNNLLNKLFSEPVITEFENGEVINTTNPEISKVNMKTLESSPELQNLRADKGIWQFESNNNEQYKSYYIKTDINESNSYDENDRIFVITVKRNDFTMTLLYYFKFIIQSVLIYIILYLIFNLRVLLKFRTIKLNFREKLFASFFIVSVLPIIFLAVYTRTYIKNKNDVNLQNQILSDVNLVSESIKGKKIQTTNYRNLDSINNIRKAILDKNLAIPDKNFNLFIRDKMISTTNEELYNSDLLDTRLDAEAYYNLYLLKKDLLLKESSIGGNSFLTGFKPMKDKDFNVTAILSSQSVFKQNEINRELTETLTYIFGSYITAIIILLILVIYLLKDYLNQYLN